MNIEPLEPLLTIYEDKDKVFREYLPINVTNKIKNFIYFDKEKNDIYLSEVIILLSKNTGEIFKNGKIIAIENDYATIKCANNICMRLNMNDYYVFIKQKGGKTNRDFYKALLNKLS
jgi:hypothetical protein